MAKTPDHLIVTIKVDATQIEASLRRMRVQARYGTLVQAALRRGELTEVEATRLLWAASRRLFPEPSRRKIH